MNKAQEMNLIANNVKKSTFNKNLYDSILKQIERKALQGKYIICIRFHNCNSEYLEPYLTQLHEDGFIASTWYTDIDKMILRVSWE